MAMYVRAVILLCVDWKCLALLLMAPYWFHQITLKRSVKIPRDEKFWKVELVHLSYRWTKCNTFGKLNYLFIQEAVIAV